jgi:hypothetical protein
MKHALVAVLVIVAAAAAFLGAVVPSASGVTPDQLVGWDCRQPGGDPTRYVCAPPGKGLPPLPGTPEFADRASSYELLVFSFATGEFLGVQKLLRPDVYLRSTPPCPQQPGGEYFYVPGIDLYACFRAT